LTWQDFYSLQRFGMTPNLDNIRLFCERLGHPEASYPSIHVGGTNGKGSVTAMLDCVLRSAGMKVGMYTSPHILRFEERIRVGGQLIPEKDVFEFLGEHWDFIESHCCTFFEVATAMGLEYFRRGGVDVAVVEVGLGGTHDATRVVQSLLSVVTRIDLDHTDRLGNTLEQIAAEKAGIFRSGYPAVTGDQRPEVLAVLKARTKEIGAEFLQAKDLISLASTSITSRQISGTATLKCLQPPLILKRWKCPLVGAYQIENVRLVLAASSLLMAQFQQINVAAIVRGIETVKWPGRLQELRRNPHLILDVAHNPGAVCAVVQNVREIWKPRKTIVIFSALRDKDIPAMMTCLKGTASEAFIVPLPPPRGMSLEEISALARKAEWNARPVLSVSEAMTAALRLAGRKDLILAIGSHYLAEEVLKYQENA